MDGGGVPGDVLEHDADHFKEAVRAAVDDWAVEEGVVLLREPGIEGVDVGQEQIAECAGIGGERVGAGRRGAAERGAMELEDLGDVAQVPMGGAGGGCVAEYGAGVNVLFEGLVERLPRQRDGMAQKGDGGWMVGVGLVHVC